MTAPELLYTERRAQQILEDSAHDDRLIWACHQLLRAGKTIRDLWALREPVWDSRNSPVDELVGG